MATTIDNVYRPAYEAPRNESCEQRARRRNQLFDSIASMDLGKLGAFVDSAAMVREMRDERNDTITRNALRMNGSSNG